MLAHRNVYLLSTFDENCLHHSVWGTLELAKEEAQRMCKRGAPIWKEVAPENEWTAESYNGLQDAPPEDRYRYVLTDGGVSDLNIQRLHFTERVGPKEES